METIRVSDQVNVDIAPDGTVYGIELLNANEQLRAEDQGNSCWSTRAAANGKKFAL